MQGQEFGEGRLGVSKQVHSTTVDKKKIKFAVELAEEVLSELRP